MSVPLMAYEEIRLQAIGDRFSVSAKLFGLTISLLKTEVIFQPAPNTDHSQPCITINDTQNVDSFR